MSVGDTLELEPTHICERDRKELIRKFEEELEQRGARIRAEVRKEYMPVDVELLPKKSAQYNQRMVRPGTGSWFQLWSLRSESQQRTLRRATS